MNQVISRLQLSVVVKQLFCVAEVKIMSSFPAKSGCGKSENNDQKYFLFTDYFEVFVSHCRSNYLFSKPINYTSFVKCSTILFLIFIVKNLTARKLFSGQNINWLTSAYLGPCQTPLVRLWEHK